MIASLNVLPSFNAHYVVVVLPGIIVSFLRLHQMKEIYTIRHQVIMSQSYILSHPRPRVPRYRLSEAFSAFLIGKKLLM